MAEFDPDVAIFDVVWERPLGNKSHLRVATVDDDDAFLAELYDFAIKHFPEGTWVNFGPDSSYREIIFFGRGRKVQLQSWHPVFETNPKLVAGSGGITSLGTRTREEFLKQDDQAYVEKRKAFDEIESRLRKHYPR